MDYPGQEISVNHMYAHAHGRKYLRREARRWRRDLAEGIRTVQPPITVTVAATFLDQNNAVDPDNLAKIVLDAGQRATGVNDRQIAFCTTPPAYDPRAIPSIDLTITLQGVRS